MIRLVAALVLLTSLVEAGAVRAAIEGRALDTGLRVEWTVGPTCRGQPQISGYLYNDRDQWAANPRLLLHSLDAAGQVTGSTWIYAISDVPPRSRSYFEAAVPGGPASYRVSVGSVDWRGYGAAGGM
ncbi:MAG TPA: hypothetical protein VFN71_01795 [Methylomirabilota bacterium]|nr:hypothetical protein [Methylomirabilota bacterium]